MADTVAILLAAGESRRMARLKALLPWQGTTLLDHQVSALKNAGVHRVIVVLGDRAESLRPLLEGREGVTWVLNPHYSRGKTTSIKAGLASLGPGAPEAVLLLNVDQPRRPETIRDLLKEHHARGGLITIPTYKGKGGHPIVVAPALMAELRSIDEESLGIKAVVRRHESDVRRLEVSDPEVLWDLNTPEEYQAALGGGTGAGVEADLA
ncbi:MAG: nucleotidyltransferase family protein [Chloroflexota bacterium]